MSTRKATAILFAAILVTAIAVSLGRDYLASRAVFARSNGFHVVIDAGHGGRDKGAAGPSGITERDINLQIAKYLQKELTARGAGVTLTRTTDDSLANPFARNQKKSDMAARQRIIEKVAPDLVISIHLNSLPSSRATRGVQTFYKKNDEQSKKFGDMIQSAFNNGNLHTNRRAVSGEFFMLDCTCFPSVLVECGFLSNPTEERLLQSPEYQKILAQTIAAGITSSPI